MRMFRGFRMMRCQVAITSSGGHGGNTGQPIGLLLALTYS